jgi:succinate dehydrogenase/fumarate reductase flavoprotein subunit
MVSLPLTSKTVKSSHTCKGNTVCYRPYFYSTNSLINTGSGIGIAYKAGVPLKDVEFVQFHPTTLRC